MLTAEKIRIEMDCLGSHEFENMLHLSLKGEALCEHVRLSAAQQGQSQQISVIIQHFSDVLPMKTQVNTV